jgi:hypothetical protein
LLSINRLVWPRPAPGAACLGDCGHTLGCKL